MTYMLRDRPDGQVEIIIHRPMLVGVFPERDMAERVRAFLQSGDQDLPEDQARGFERAESDAAEAAAEDLDAVADIVDKVDGMPRTSARSVRLPAVVKEKPQPPARLPVVTHNLTEDQINTAFSRIHSGEKIAAVAMELGLTMFQLRGMWANQKQKLQKHMAEGGKQKCKQCERMFTPSLSSPDLCARCSHE